MFTHKKNQEPQTKFDWDIDIQSSEKSLVTTTTPRYAPTPTPLINFYFRNYKR